MKSPVYAAFSFPFVRSLFPGIRSNLISGSMYCLIAAIRSSRLVIAVLDP